MNLENYITIIIVILFIFLIYKTRVSPLINRMKKKDNPGNTTAVRVKNVSSDTDTQPRIKRKHYEVLAFNEHESDNSVMFRERIDIHLSRAITELTDKGADYSVEFVPLSDTLVIVVSYEL